MKIKIIYFVLLASMGFVLNLASADEDRIERAEQGIAQAYSDLYKKLRQTPDLRLEDRRKFQEAIVAPAFQERNEAFLEHWDGFRKKLEAEGRKENSSRNEDFLKKYFPEIASKIVAPATGANAEKAETGPTGRKIPQGKRSPEPSFESNHPARPLPSQFESEIFFQKYPKAPVPQPSVAPKPSPTPYQQPSDDYFLGKGK